MWSDPFNFTDLTSYTWFLGHYAPGTPAILIFPKHFSSAPVSVVFDLQIATWLIATLPSYQFSSVAQSCPTLCDPMDCSTPGFLSITNSQSLLKLTSITSVMSSNHLILRHPLLLLSSVFPGIRVFSSESVLRIYWPKYWSFSFSISPSNEYSGPISFRMDRLDLLAAQGTLKSLLPHHSSKASVLWHSAFFIVQLSYPYMTTGKTLTLTRWTFVGKVMSLFLNMLSRLVIVCLQRSKCLLISWLQSLSEVVLEAPK